MPLPLILAGLAGGAVVGAILGAVVADDDSEDDKAKPRARDSKPKAQPSRKSHQDNSRMSGSKAAGFGAGVVGGAANYADNVGFSARQGHGFAAEQANHLADRFSSKDAQLLGGDNAKHGADRRIGDVLIQSKYCSSGAKCIEQCFENGKFKYFADGSPMQIEVPSDMYEKAVKAMEDRIKENQVEGIFDPAKAREIVRKGSFTYAQAKNIARFGTIDSLCYDAKNGVELSVRAMGISAALSFAVAVWNGEDLEAAMKRACVTGIKVGGVAWVGNILASQLGRTGIEQALRGSTDWVVKQIGSKAAATLANALRSGGSIYGAAATNHASKLLRGNVVTGIATTIVLSSVDFTRMFQGRISVGQLVKNVATTASGVAGGTAGWMGGAAAGAAAGSVIPGVGTAIGGVVGGIVGGIAGGFAGGAAASEAAKAVLDELIEDDAKEMLEIVEEVFGTLCVDYLLNEEEARAVLDDLQNQDLPVVLRDMYESDNRHTHARRILKPLVEEQARARKRITLPSNEDMVKQTGLILQQAT